MFKVREDRIIKGKKTATAVMGQAYNKSKEFSS
jgi:hypothetical protein